MRRLTGIWVVLLGVGLLLCGAMVVRAQECEPYLRLIQENMPKGVGDANFMAKILKVPANDWHSKLEPQELFRSVDGSEAPDKRFGNLPVGVIKSKNSLLKYNLIRGELRYINRLKAFNPRNPGSAYDPTKAQDMVLKLLFGNLGMPEAELPMDKLKGQVLNGAINTIRSQKPEKVLPIETSFFAPRIINDLPVLGSTATIGISNQGGISQFRVRWPVLLIDPAFRESKPIPLEDVTKMVYERLMQAQGCEKSFARFNMFPAYTPVRSNLPDDDKTPAVARPVYFVPKLIVQFLPEVGNEAGELLEFDLLTPGSAQ